MKYWICCFVACIYVLTSSLLYAAAPAEIQSSDTIAKQLVSKNNVNAPYMVTGEAIVGLLKELVDFDIDEASIVFHRKTGKLFVKNTPNNQEEVKTILQMVRSYKPQQVLIEARIIEVTSFEGFDLGVDWKNVQKQNKNKKNTFAGSLDFTSGNWGNTPLNPLNEMNLSYAYLNGNNKLNVALTALEQEGKVNTLSSPKIICFNNQRANIRIETATDYVAKITTTTVFTNDNPNVESSADIETAVEGIVMDVTPTIDANGENITLDLHPTVVELVSLESVDLGASGTIRVPKYVRRSADTTVSVVDGGTVVLGGLMKRTKSKEVRKVPFLGDIPLIKNLFRSETTYEKKSNLIIFITAKILS